MGVVHKQPLGLLTVIRTVRLACCVPTGLQGGEENVGVWGPFSGRNLCLPLGQVSVSEGDSVADFICMPRPCADLMAPSPQPQPLHTIYTVGYIRYKVV